MNYSNTFSVLEQHVCTKDQGVMLKKLGVEQESIFYWWEGYWLKKEKPAIMVEKWNSGRTPICSVFTVSEIAILIRWGSNYVSWSADGKWIVQYSEKQSIRFDTQAAAYAAVLIYVIENKLINLKEINKIIKQTQN